MDNFLTKKELRRRRRERVYAQLPQSNTEFLNFVTIDKDKRQAKADIEALKNDYYKRIDALPASATNERNALFAELEQKMKQRNADLADLEEAQKAKRKAERGEKISSGLQKLADLFTKTAGAMGVGKTVQGEPTGAGAKVVGGGDGGFDVLREDKRGRVMPIWVWIVGGLIVVGAGIYAIQKFKK